VGASPAARSALDLQRLLGELGENAQLDRAKENFGPHEPESDLLDPVGARLCAHRWNPQNETSTTYFQ
jgi:hypothetical protein